jgi:hypothetical protein
VSAATSSLAATVAPVVADGIASATVTAIARNAAGVPLAGRTAVFSVSGSENQLSTAEATTGASGEASATVTSTRAEAKTISVEIDGVLLEARPTVSFIPGAAVAGASTIAAGAAPVVADGVSEATLTVTARDAHGNPVPEVTVALAVTSGVLSSTTVETGPEGTATVSLTSTAAVPVEVVASLGGAPLPSPAVAFFKPGPAAKLAFDVQPAPAVAGEILSPVEVLVLDARGNPVGAGSRPISVALLEAPDGALVGTRTVLSVDGRATFPALEVRLARAGHALVALDVGGELSSGTSVSFTVSAAAPAAAQFATLPAPSAGQSAAIRAQVFDPFGNAVSGAPVTLVASGSGNAISAAPATDATGWTEVTFSATKAELKTIGVYASGGTTALATSQLAVSPSAPSAGTSSLVPSASEAPDDGTRIDLTLTLRDAYANPIPSEGVTLSASGGASLASSSATTDAEGIATSAVWSTTTGPITATATAGTTTVASAGVTFTPAPPSRSLSTAALDRASAPANGVTKVQATVVVRDTGGRPMTGRSVQIAYTGVATLTPTTATTDGTGAARFDLTAASATQGDVSARVSPGTPGELRIDEVKALAFVGCPEGDAYCGAEACKDLDTDAAHCGACGAVCGPFEHAAAVSCAARACVVDTCTTSYGDCDGVAANGCEIDLRTTEAHCGACGNPCADGSTCSDGLCVPPEFVSNGAEGALVVQSGTVTLAAGFHDFTSVDVAAGATLAVSPVGNTGVLEIRATGPITIAGTVDVSGGAGGNGACSGNGNATGGGGGETATRATAPPNTAGGTVVVGWAGGAGTAPGGLNGGGAGGGGLWDEGCWGFNPPGGGGGGSGWAGGAGGGSVDSEGCGFAVGGSGGGPSFGGVGGTTGGGDGGIADDPRYDGAAGDALYAAFGAGGGGSIGTDAASDLPLATTFRPGSGGGGAGFAGGGGGGGGGALRIASLQQIVVAGSGRILANGGAGGGSSPCATRGGGGGSGGVIDLAAPSISLAPGSVVSAVGGAGTLGGGAGGLGRIRLSLTPDASSAAGAAIAPPLSDGVVPAPAEPGAAFVRSWP